MIFVEGTTKDAMGDTVIRSKLGPSTSRLDFEQQFFRGIEVGLPGWERAHSQGQGTGHESPHAIRYAPREVNQVIQNRGIERYLRELYRLKPSDTVLWLTTVTATFPRTLRLKEIQYRVDAVKGPTSRRLFECSIEIEDKRSNPRVHLQATPFLR